MTACCRRLPMFGTIFSRIWRRFSSVVFGDHSGSRSHPAIQQLGHGRVVAGTDAAVLAVEDQRGEGLVDDLLPRFFV